MVVNYVIEPNEWYGDLKRDEARSDFRAHKRTIYEFCKAGVESCWRKKLYKYKIDGKVIDSEGCGKNDKKDRLGTP